ncbi:MAG: diguanylate cyclase [Candidatus Hinthialibacter antarcticus]|nr:diguanylate cyclase [Candidatus Hinthialibacter antarcticus]
MITGVHEAPIDISSLKESQSLDKPRTLLALGLDESETESLQYLNELGYIIENGRKRKNLYEQILSQIPNVLILDIDALDKEAIELTKQLKENPLTYTMPIIIVLGSHDLLLEIAVLEAGAEDYVVKPFSPNVLAARIHTSMRRNIRLQVSNPLTGLPGALYIEEQVTRRLEDKIPTAMCYADLDNFKAFNDHYGYSRGDNLIRILATILHEAVSMHGRSGDFVAHIGGDDFVMVVNYACIDAVCKYVVLSFDALAPFQYEEKEMNDGHILAKNRQGEEMKLPLASVSVGVVSNERRDIVTYLEMTELAAEMKEFSKSVDKYDLNRKSLYRVDKRSR